MQTIIRIADLLFAEFNRRLRADFDLSASAGIVLAIIDGAGEPITPGVVAERAIVTSATITSMLDTLEQRGLVVRRRHATDRRKVLLELTDAGRATVDLFLPGIYGLQTRVMARLSPAERRQLRGLLDRVLAQTAVISGEEPEPLGGVRRVPERLRRPKADPPPPS